MLCHALIDRDILYFLAQAFRARLMKALSSDKAQAGDELQALVHKSKSMLKELAQISLAMELFERDRADWPAWCAACDGVTTRCLLPAGKRLLFARRVEVFYMR